jgi:hypothetical protein
MIIVPTPILLILSFNTIPLFVSWLTTTYNYFIMTTCKSVLAILVLFTDFKVVTVVSITLGNILFNLIFLVLP